MNRKTRFLNVATIVYALYVILLIGTSILLNVSRLGHYNSVLPGVLPNVLFINFVFSVISLRGLLIRARYSYYLAIGTLLVTAVPLIVSGIFISIFTVPLLVVSLISLALLIKEHRYFNFPTKLFDRPEVSVSIVIIIMVLLIGVLGTILLGSQFKPKITNFETALYYTGEVVTTLGFGDILPITRTAQLFSISMSLIGIGSLFGAVTVIVGPLIYERGKRVVGVIQNYESRRMANYVLFIDFNPLLDSLLSDLIKNDELVIIATDDNSKARMLEDKKIFLETDGNIEKIVAPLDLRRARRIVLGSEDDGKNVLYALHILSKYPGDEVKQKVISLVNLSSNAERIRPLVGNIIHPSSLIAEHSKALF